jgi:hypothetical protein
MMEEINNKSTLRPKYLTDKEIFELKAKLFKLYTGVRYQPKPCEEIYLPIKPKGFLDRFF